ncbi:hypothetical protein DAPPUDRAFT_239366 [Daphnia pulex]|uniref:Uncharacterized protein n=1 Tax=Daphnia pulex TaxID=6669 RepID=E9G940_DAPPU|nr:hypothetical protein DAPPUDRAFT_239366 [Daphnia pulex]|eukprot:EFX84165.1 hypothetical protein DAPPUDRAFT_239366 [Daphnia pulex]
MCGDKVMQRKRREDGHQNVAVNPLTATPLCSPARAALFGLVVLQATGSECRQAQNLPQGACYKAMHHAPPPLSARTCQQWQVPLGHGSFRRGA